MIESIESKTILLTLWVLLLLLNIYMMFRIMPQGSEKIKAASANSENIELLDVQVMGFGKEKAFSVLSDMGEQGRRKYAVFAMREDLFFPLAYGLFLAFTLYLVTTKLFPDHRKLIIIVTLIPLAGMVMDFIENYHILKLIKQFPDLQSSTVFIAAAANSLKWGAAFISIGLILMFGVLVVNAKIAGKKTQIHA